MEWEYVVWELLAIGIISIALITYVSNVTNDSTYWRSYYARDTALLIDLLPAADGDVSLTYNQLSLREPDSAFIFDFLTDRVSVADADDPDRRKVISFPVAKDASLSFVESSFAPYVFYLKKTGMTVNITPELTESGCSNINTQQDIAQIKVAFVLPDAQLQPSPEERARSDRIKAVAEGVRSALQIQGVPREAITLSEGPADVVISFSAPAVSEQQSIVYYDITNQPLNMQKFICLLNQNNTVAVRPVRSYHELEVYIPGAKDVLKNGIAIHISLGTETDTVSKSIAEAILEYYA